MKVNIHQLKLWARMLCCGTDYEIPPRVPMITGSLPRHTKKDSFSEALTGAAEAVVKALSPRSTSLPSQPTTACVQEVLGFLLVKLLNCTTAT